MKFLQKKLIMIYLIQCCDVRNKNFKLIINFDSDRIIRVPGDIMMGDTYKTMLEAYY